MKKILVILSVSLAALVASSCSTDNLDIPQKFVVSYDDIFGDPNNEANAFSALVTVYNHVFRGLGRGNANTNAGIWSPQLNLWNAPSDDIWATGWNFGDNEPVAQLNEFRFDYSNQMVESFYRNMYASIYPANELILSFDKTTNANVKRYIAEARVWRAWCYMQLAIGWGTPPLVTEVLVGDVYPENSAPGEVLDFVIKELGEAAADLPSKPSKTNRDATIRLTKEAAYSFLGKAQIFAGKYADAMNNLKTNVIDKNLYELVSGPALNDLFHKGGKYSTEAIFEFNVYLNAAMPAGSWNAILPGQHNDNWAWHKGNWFANNGPSQMYNGWGGPNVSGSFGDALIENDGIGSHRRKAAFFTYDEVLYNLTWSTDGANPTVDLKRKDAGRGVRRGGDANGILGNSGYFHQKRGTREADIFSGRSPYSDKNYMIMRYAEVLLLYAEACVQSGQNIPHALQMVNMIQERAGSQTISSSLTMDVIKNEKRFELWMEGCRWADLVRWGDAAEVLKNKGEGPNKNAVPKFLGSARITAKGDEIDPTWEFTGDHGTWDDRDKWVIHYWPHPRLGAFVKGKHELFPFPKWAIERNKILKQNPGY